MSNSSTNTDILEPDERTVIDDVGVSGAQCSDPRMKLRKFADEVVMQAQIFASIEICRFLVSLLDSQRIDQSGHAGS
jgi:hypothetical protein